MDFPGSRSCVSYPSNRPSRHPINLRILRGVSGTTPPTSTIFGAVSRYYSICQLKFVDLMKSMQEANSETRNMAKFNTAECIMQANGNIAKPKKGKRCERLRYRRDWCHLLHTEPASCHFLGVIYAHATDCTQRATERRGIKTDLLVF